MSQLGRKTTLQMIARIYTALLEKEAIYLSRSLSQSPIKRPPLDLKNTC
jgi:hypothetical protein